MHYYLIFIFVGYILGSFPSALIFARRAGIPDIREVESGTMGTYNVLRNAGKKAAGFTVFFDLLKGTAAVIISRQLAEYFAATGFTPAVIAGLLGAYGAVLGHMFPIFAGFRGGKSLAVYCGSMAFLSVPVLALNVIGWLISFKVIGKIAVSSLLAFTILPPLTVLAVAGLTPLFWYLLVAGITIGLRHYSDLKDEIKNTGT